jgi:hypothetical protein
MPEEYPERTTEELRQILDDEYEKWKEIDQGIMDEREIWFKDFQQSLSQFVARANK